MNYLKFNDEKTEFLIVGSKHPLAKVTTKGIQISEHVIQPSSLAQHIGTVFEANVQELQFNSVCKVVWYQLFNISKIRRCLSTDPTKTVIHAYVTSKINQNKCLLYRKSRTKVSKIQCV